MTVSRTDHKASSAPTGDADAPVNGKLTCPAGLRPLGLMRGRGRGFRAVNCDLGPALTSAYHVGSASPPGLSGGVRSFWSPPDCPPCMEWITA
jgi:hypothetical protein